MTRFWDQVAGLPGLSAVIDYQATESCWARYINALHLRAIRAVIQPGPEDRVLDFGCGVGRISSWLAPRVAEVIGVDTSSAMVDEARRRNRHPNVRYHLIAEENLGALPASACDRATAIWVIQHILDDKLRDDALDGIVQALKPGGSLYTLDRLCRDPLDHGESDYIRLRVLDDYTAAFRARGLKLLTCRPVAINEQVLNRPGLTDWLKRHGLPPWVLNRVAALDLGYARRQRQPLVADYIFHFVKT